MSEFQIPEGEPYRFKVKRAVLNMGVDVSLYRKYRFWPFWVKVDRMILFDSKHPDTSLPELTERAKRMLWADEEYRRGVQAELRGMGL